MDFKLTEEQLMIQQAARDFAKMELLPGVIERDEHSKFPTEQVKKMAELGFMGMMVDPKYGGSGLDSISYVLAMTESAKVDASAAVIMSVNNSLVCAGMEKYCSEELLLSLAEFLDLSLCKYFVQLRITRKTTLPRWPPTSLRPPQASLARWAPS